LGEVGDRPVVVARAQVLRDRGGRTVDYRLRRVFIKLGSHLGPNWSGTLAAADPGSVLFAASRVLHLGAVIAAVILMFHRPPTPTSEQPPGTSAWPTSSAPG
jgi:hypothetical protein